MDIKNLQIHRHHEARSEAGLGHQSAEGPGRAGQALSGFMSDPLEDTSLFLLRSHMERVVPARLVGDFLFICLSRLRPQAASSPSRCCRRPAGPLCPRDCLLPSVLLYFFFLKSPLYVIILVAFRTLPFALSCPLYTCPQPVPAAASTSAHGAPPSSL